MSQIEAGLDPTIANLQKLEAVDVFKLAIEMANTPLQHIGAEMGWSNGQARRVYSTDKYFPSFPEIPRFCSVVGNLTVINWLLVQAMNYGVDHDSQDVDCRSLVGRVGELFGETGDVGQAVQKAIQDGELSPSEIRRIIRELNDVVTRSTALIGDLRLQEQHILQQAKEAGRG